jgi:hypothetical protein
LWNHGDRKWHYLSRLAKDIDLDYIMFEPMSIRREIPSTIAETEELYERINKGAARSGKEEDRNPYAWVRTIRCQNSRVLHISE